MASADAASSPAAPAAADRPTRAGVRPGRSSGASRHACADAAVRAETALSIADQCGFRFYSLKAHHLLSRFDPDEEQRLRHHRVTRNLSRSLAANLGREDAETFLSIYAPS